MLKPPPAPPRLGRKWACDMVDGLVCIIPARGGSKRIRRKSLVDMGGIPMIGHTISAAVKSGLFGAPYVSTDDEEIARVSERYGAQVPFMRPPELATDAAALQPVCLHVLEELEARGKRYEHLCLLMPNCPLRTAQDIVNSYEAYRASGRDFLMSVTDYGGLVPFWALRKEEDGTLVRYWPEDYHSVNSQCLPDVYCPSGAIRWARVEAFRAQRTFYGEGLVGYALPRDRAIDIDDPMDLLFARSLLAFKNGQAEGGTSG